jgi:transposase
MTQVRRWRRAGGTGFQWAGGAKGKLTEAQAAELEEVLAREGFLTKPRPDRTALQ